MKYLGIDFGLKRIGLATSEGELSSAWKILEVRNFEDAITKLQQEIAKEKFDKVVLGKPEGKIGKLVERFRSSLVKLGVAVEIADETLSTHNAISRMVELDIPKRKRKLNDAYSAAEILQEYLDNNQ